MAAYNLLQNAGTGNFTTRAIKLPSANVLALLTTTVGSTPTATVTLQGSHDGTNYATVVQNTITTATTTKFTKGAGEVYLWYQIVVASNTNVTFTVMTIMGSEP